MTHLSTLTGSPAGPVSSLAAGSTPTVSVLLATFNDAPYLRQSVPSVLSQTFQDLELLVVDDGSTDESSRYLRAISDADPRVRVLHNEHNLGLTRSLERGLREARGEYIARLDADDTCAPERLELQVASMRREPSLGLLGTFAERINDQGNLIGLQAKPKSDIQIRWHRLFASPFIHSTVFLRRSILEQHQLNYDPDFRLAQDYELWSRLIQVTKTANLPLPLVRWRVRHGTGARNREEQLQNHFSISQANLQKLAPDLPLDREEVVELHSMLVESRQPKGIRAPALIELDLELLGRFGQLHAGAPLLRSLLLREVTKAIQNLGGIASLGGQGRFLRRAFSLAPGWPLLYGWRLFKKRSVKRTADIHESSP